MSDGQLFYSWQTNLSTKKYFKKFWVWWGIYAFLLYIFLVLYLFTKPYGLEVFFAAGISLVLSRGVISEIIYFLYKKQRPYQSYKFKQPKSWFFSWGGNRQNSFPSGHSVSSAAISGAVLYYDASLGVLALLVALMIGMGRVVLGYHYFTDIFAGWFLGFICALLTVKYLIPLLFTTV